MLLKFTLIVKIFYMVFIVVLQYVLSILIVDK